MPDRDKSPRNPWAWVPSLYFAEGLPYVAVMSVAVILYKGLGISNSAITFYTAWLYLPWVIKPLWSPAVDLLRTRRSWIWVMQLFIGGGLAGVALTIPGPDFFRYTLACFWLLAFSSATHDIAVDGFYMLALSEKQQAFFSGIRNTSYRLSTLCGQGLLVVLVGVIQNRTGLPALELSVSARMGAAAHTVPISPLAMSAPLDGPLRLILDSPTLELGPQSMSRSEAGALIAFAASNNITLGFRPPEIAPSKTTTPGAWSRLVAEPLKSWLQAHFSVAGKPTNDFAGNVGLAGIRLSRSPGREVVVNVSKKVRFSFTGSDAGNFSVVEGARLVFNDRNWNHPAFVAVQLDPRLSRAAAAEMEIRSGGVPYSWMVAFLVLAGMFVCFGLYHRFILPRPTADQASATRSPGNLAIGFWQTLTGFFRKEGILALLLFLLFYRFAEAQLVRMVGPFLLDGREAGGLGLTAAQYGFAYGTLGIAALMAGGLLGGFLVARNGLKFWLWWMVAAIHLPDAVFVYLAGALPDNYWIITLCLAIEQFGYGFGFSAYMLYMIYIARGPHSTAHYAICTGFMALGMMLPGMSSGWLADIIGYHHFFIWVLLATIPGFVVTALVPLDPSFGRKSEAG